MLALSFITGQVVTATELNDIVAAINNNTIRNTRHVADGSTGGPQSIANATDTILQFPVARNTDPCIIVSGTNNTTFKVAPGYAGKYLITASYRLTSTTTSQFELAILVNGGRKAMDGSGTNRYEAACSVVITLADNDEIKANGWHNSGGARSPDAGFGDTSQLSIARLGSG